MLTVDHVSAGQDRNMPPVAAVTKQRQPVVPNTRTGLSAGLVSRTPTMPEPPALTSTQLPPLGPHLLEVRQPSAGNPGMALLEP